MSWLSDDFLDTLLSNVKGNPRNTYIQYETTLAKFLDLSGEWEVVLINLSYPHKWLVFYKPKQYLIMLPSTPNPISLKVNTIEAHL